MQTFGMLGALLAAVGVGVAPSAAFGFESSAQFAQNIYLQQPKLDLPSSLINAAPSVNQQKTPSTGSVDKQSDVEKKSNSKARIELNLTRIPRRRKSKRRRKARKIKKIKSPLLQNLRSSQSRERSAAELLWLYKSPRFSAGHLKRTTSQFVDSGPDFTGEMLLQSPQD